MNRHTRRSARNIRSRRHRPFAVTALAALAAIALPLGAVAEERADGWSWSVTPYAWATDVGVDVAIDDRQIVDETIAVEDLLEDLETIAQVRLEAQNGSFGLFLDLFDVTLSDDAAAVALPTGGTATVTPEMGMTIAEVGGFYDPNGDRQGLQILVGARILNERAEIDARFAFADGSSSARLYELDDTMVDGLVGIRYLRSFGERWSFETRADVSTGGTELTWSVGPTIGYSFGEQRGATLTAGYRRMVVEFETESPSVDAEMTLSGPVLGLRLAF